MLWSWLDPGCQKSSNHLKWNVHFSAKASAFASVNTSLYFSRLILSKGVTIWDKAHFPQEKWWDCENYTRVRQRSSAVDVLLGSLTVHLSWWPWLEWFFMNTVDFFKTKQKTNRRRADSQQLAASTCWDPAFMALHRRWGKHKKKISF